MRRHSELSQKVKTFEQDFVKLKNLFPENGHQLEKHISDWTLFAGNLYTRKVNQINNRPYSFLGRILPLPNDVLDEVFVRNSKDYLSSFERLVKTGVHHGEKVDQKARSLMIRWSNLMLDFFLDLKELEMFPKPRSEEYPSEDAGQFVLSYVLGRSPPFDIATSYAHKNFKETVVGYRNKRLMDMVQG
jgi:hypothetical protein